MYIEFFRLSEPPFSLTPDPRYLFMSERHREGLAHLLYGVQQSGGFVQLTGEVGSGKTTLSRCLVRQLPADTEVALILNPRLNAVELLATVCDELRISYPAGTASIKVLVDVLNKHLLEAHAQRRRIVLIIDEAQNLTSDVLEQIRLLTNLETSQEKLLQIILIGQPELLSLLKRKGLRQLAQRITARYHLQSLSRSDTEAYIQHRLKVAGCKEPVFTDSAMRCVYRLSGGVPRLINIICDRALLGAYAADKRRIGVAIVRRASRETRGIVPWYRTPRIAWSAGVAVILALILGGALFFNSANPLARRIGTAINPKKSGTAVKSPPAASVASQAAPDLQPEKGGEASPNRQAKANAPAAAASGKSEQLSSLLSDASSRGINPGFSDLFVRWGIKPSTNPTELTCKSGRAYGLDCLFLTGGWPKLRRYNVPAILEIILPDGARKRVAIAGLSNETATLVINGHERLFPISEVDRVWDGSFIIMWKPPFTPRQLALGAQGEDVAWIRRALDTLEKKSPAAEVPDVYDAELQKRIVAFQRKQSLIQDGFIGSETLVRLTLALGEAKAPSLTASTR
jgi:general secretion pathway protein A